MPTSCSASCNGGLRAESRACVGARCGGTCEGDSLRIVPCNAQPCPVDCVVAAFQDVTTCSVTCGTGVKTQQSKIVRPASHGGKGCPALTRLVPCATDIICPTDCVLGDWKNMFECSADCGGGTQLQVRSVIVGPANGGAPCDDFVRLVPCNTAPCPEDCRMNPWVATLCSKECGSGTLNRTRAIDEFPAFGGESCLSANQVNVPCNPQQCSVVQTPRCKTTPWKDATQCSSSCGSGFKRQARELAANDENAGKCAPPVLSRHVPCARAACAPATDCKVSDWREEQSCSSSCGGGARTLVRDLLVPPTGDGEPCPSFTKIVPCNAQACPDPEVPKIDCVVGNWNAAGNCR
jgi:hypothetical protein